MTENQTKEVFNLLTKCVVGIQEIRADVAILKTDVSELKADVSELKADVSELKADVSELKAGQKRIEKEVRLNTFAVNEVVSEHFRLKIRVDEMEKLAA
ncbi:MAG: hypothetical protein LH614_13760 [Pyrinomonadaceae bacterium]|nr:hypothetical protein [Pyrinomonadaceae bacterium]